MSRTARRTDRRRMLRDLRERRRAVKAVAGGAAQTARTHLLAVGLPADDAKRFAGAFSRGVTADLKATTVIRTGHGRRKTVDVKLYVQTTFLGRLAQYRPAEPAAAARFETVAAFALAG